MNGSAHGQSLKDMKVALELAVLKRGVYVLAFHPYAWVRNDQVVDLIDDAVRAHGDKIRFLSFRDVQDRLDRNLLGGQPLRAANGQDNGVRLLDVNGDGYMDVVIGNEHLRMTRIWDPEAASWKSFGFPVSLVAQDPSGERRDAGVRFGVLDREGDATVCVMVRNEDASGCWRFDRGRSRWMAMPNGLRGLEWNSDPIMTARDGRDAGVRMRKTEEGDFHGGEGIQSVSSSAKSGGSSKVRASKA